MKKMLKSIEEALKFILRIIAKIILYIFCKIVFRLKIVGRKNVPKNEALIFCGNHRSYMDPPFIIASSPRDMRFMAKEDLKKNFILRFFIFVNNGYYVSKETKENLKMLKEALKDLKSGKCIGIFPEGTRNGFEKNHGKIKNGAAYMSLKTGAKMIPVGIKGTIKPFHKITITYGMPLDFSYLLEKGPAKEVEGEASEILKEKILELIK